MKRHKQVGISENDFRGRLNSTPKRQDKKILYSNKAIVFFIISIHSFNCSSVITNGGAKRIIFVCVGLASKPFSANFKQISHAKSFVSSLLIINAFSNPLPRTKKPHEMFRTVSHLFPEYQSQPVCPVRQLFVPYYLKRRNSHCRSNRISAKSGAMLPRTDNIHHFIDDIPQKQDRPHPIKPFPKSEYPDEHSHSHKPAIYLYGQCRSALHRL